MTINPALLPSPALFDVTSVAKKGVEGRIVRASLEEIELAPNARREISADLPRRTGARPASTPSRPTARRFSRRALPGLRAPATTGRSSSRKAVVASYAVSCVASSGTRPGRGSNGHSPRAVGPTCIAASTLPSFR